VGKLYLLCACVDQGAEALNSELGYMNTKGGASTRLARLAEVDKAVAIGETQFRFLPDQLVGDLIAMEAMVLYVRDIDLSSPL
jgi:hypothetical protein